ncbi:lactonase family protein [Portibacter lacus]|uniref:6-phosphogluconolactonase n=1 Tax=Portibacter lacus TaxID=1099794 RepID=A0AA37STA1_9BACT|nr:lactonase family protein [Portibacter lacus]GLR19852.1 6-phosphogluconolactonase [Portibacter lacus]
MKIKLYLSIFLICTTNLLISQDNNKTYLFAGSYTSGEKAEGIIVYNFNPETGALNEVEREDDLVNPSFLTISPNGKFLYACTETKMKQSGSVSAFSIDSLSGKIAFINKQKTAGKNPVYVTVDHTGSFVVSANYTDAVVDFFICNPDGSLQQSSQSFEFEGNSIIKGNQDVAHMHSVVFSPDNNFLFAPDLGSDKIHAFDFSINRFLTLDEKLTVQTNKGVGPRHFVFHPNRRYGYCVEELSGTVAFYTYNDGRLKLSNTYPLYKTEQDKYASADIHISPDGRFLYASNRQEEHSIAIFEIDTENGELTMVGHQSTHGETPRSFVIDPSGKFLLVANQSSDQIVVFRRNMETGMLTKIGTKSGLKAPSSLKMYRYGG